MKEPMDFESKLDAWLVDFLAVHEVKEARMPQLNSLKQAILAAHREELIRELKAIVSRHTDPELGTTDFDGIAQEVIATALKDFLP